VALARAHGCHGECVTQPEEVRPALERALEANAGGAPAVLAFVVEAFDYYPGFVSFTAATWQDDGASAKAPAGAS
jgi:thiamine pyrophosphate-dependent acetolactate synthase large subunit-like protein